MGEFDKYLSRRIMGESGWMYFCRICGQYLPEDNFYTDEKNTFGKKYTCKKHFNRRSEDDDNSMKHLNLGKLKESDFLETQILLTNLGYRFDRESPPVWIQFNEKHGLNKK